VTSLLPFHRSRFFWLRFSWRGRTVCVWQQYLSIWKRIEGATPNKKGHQHLMAFMRDSLGLLHHFFFFFAAFFFVAFFFVVFFLAAFFFAITRYLHVT